MGGHDPAFDPNSGQVDRRERSGREFGLGKHNVVTFTPANGFDCDVKPSRSAGEKSDILRIDPNQRRGEFTCTQLACKTTVPTAHAHLLQFGVSLQRGAMRSHKEPLRCRVEIDTPTDTGELVEDVQCRKTTGFRHWKLA